LALKMALKRHLRVPFSFPNRFEGRTSSAAAQKGWGYIHKMIMTWRVSPCQA
jgi:hypothetical protein